MTEVYGVGAFLAAGCQIYKMAVDTEADYIKIWPDRKTMQGNPLSGWVVYANENVSDDFWKKYDHIYVPEKGTTVKISDYARTLYIRTHWYFDRLQQAPASDGRVETVDAGYPGRRSRTEGTYTVCRTGQHRICAKCFLMICFL